jgi:hypothetical protein
MASVKNSRCLNFTSRFSDAVVLKKFGDVPEDLSAL